MFKIIKKLLIIQALMLAGTASAQTADEIRGGWVADINGTRHIYIVKIEGDKITGGLYCWDCLNQDNIAFIREGTLENGELNFTVLHDRGENAPYVRTVHGKMINGELMVTSQGGENPNENAIAFERQSRISPRPPFVLPEVAASAPYEALSIDAVVGRWVSRSGLGDRKQYMMLRVVDGEIKGLVCGPCDNVHNMGPIDNGAINGSQLYLEIIHEDVGTPEGLNNAPNYAAIDITIVDNELYLTSNTSTSPPGTAPFKMMFVGPVKP